MRGAIALLTAIGVGAVGTPVVMAAPAPRSPPVIVFAGPAQGPPSVRAARDRLDALARQRSTVLVDLSPQPPVQPRAGEHLRRAVEAYQDFQYDRARELLERGLTEVTDTGAAGVAREELSDLLIYRGLVQTQRGDDAGAWEDFLRAAVVSPTRRLDPVRFPPRVIEAFGRAVQTVQSEPPVEITVDAPAACALWIDGVTVEGQRTTALRRGDHYLRAECPGMQPSGARFTADAASTIRPSLTRVEVPDLPKAIEEARRRGADSVIWASTIVPDGERATLTLRLIDLRDSSPTGRELGRVFTRLDGGDDATTAAAGLIDRIVEPVAPIVVPRAQRWYERPWVWGIAGAAIATAIILPFAIDSPAPSGWRVPPLAVF